MADPKVLCVIPARFGSTRFPGKPLVMIGKKPMIQWTYESASKSTRIGKTVVATDDHRIEEAVREFGGEVIMTSPFHPSGTDRIIEVASRLNGFDVILNVQGDEPGIEMELIDGVLELKQRRMDWPMSTAAVPIRDESEIKDPNRVKVVIDQTGKALYFSRSAIPSDFKSKARHFRHLGIYAYNLDFLLGYNELPESPLEQSESLEQLRAMEAGYPIGVFMASEAALSIDHPEDVRKVVESFRKKGLLSQ